MPKQTPKHRPILFLFVHRLVQRFFALSHYLISQTTAVLRSPTSRLLISTSHLPSPKHYLPYLNRSVLSALLVFGLVLGTVYTYTRGGASPRVLNPFAVQIASAAPGINRQINFQGKLVNPNGTNVTNGTYSIVFSIYTVSSGGVAVWTETQTPTLTNGIFQVNLGSVTALPGSVDFNTDNLYLGIRVGADAEMTPRVQFTAVPQAFNAERLGGLTSSGFIQNTTTQQAATNFNIAGTGVIGTSLTTPILQSAPATGLTITGNATSTISTTAGNLNLQAGGTGTINLTPSSATALVNVLTGNLKVGDGTPTVALNGEDAYIEGTLEVDGTTRFDGAITATAGLTITAGGAAITGTTTITGATTISGNTTIATTAGNTLSIGNSTGTLTVTGSSASSFVFNGTTVTATEFNLLDGKNAPLVDTNDAVATAITGTGALNSGSITSGFGTINNADTITGTTINGTTGINTGAGAGTQRIDASGNLVNVGNLTQSGSIASSKNNVTTYSNVYSWGTTAATQTGTLQLTLPNTWNNSMVRFTIVGYDYSGTAAWRTTVSGYNYNVTPAWINTSAEIGGGAPFTQVRLAYDSVLAKNVILLGNTSTVWNFPQISITEVVAGYGAQTTWGSGYTSSFLTAETNVTNINSPTVQTVAYTSQTFLQGGNSFGTTAILGTNDAQNLVLETAGVARLTVSSTGTVNVGSSNQFQVAPTGLTSIVTSTGGPLLYVKEAGSGYANANAAIVADTDNPTGTANFLFQGRLAGTNVFSVRADGLITGVGANIGTGLLQGTGGATLTGTVAINTTGTAVTSIGNTTGSITITGNSSSTINFNGVALSATELNYLDGKNAPLVDTNDAVATAITGTGALNSGSITSGFGTINNADTITGTTINGTTGINTGAGAGTQRIDASGNLVNIGTYSGTGNITTTGAISAVGLNASGYQTQNTSSTFSGQYTRLASCTLTLQFQDCRTQATIVSLADGGSFDRTMVDIRVKQQNAMAGLPYIVLQLSQSIGITTADIVAVTTQNDATATTVELYGRINATFRVWNMAPLINAGTNKFTWQSNQAFSTTLPAGVQTAATYANDGGLAGSYFLQGGNSFGTTATIGTNDAQSLVLETAGTTRLTINSVGGATFSGSLNIVGDLSGNSKVIARTTDAWLRFNPDNAFTNGIYLNTGIVRTDGNLQVGASGASFNVTSTGVTTIAGAVTLSVTTGTALNISNVGVVTDVNLQNGETIDNDLDGTIRLTAGTVSTTGMLSLGGAGTGNLLTINTSNTANTSGGLLIQASSAGSAYLRYDRQGSWAGKLYVGNNASTTGNTPTNGLTIDGTSGTNRVGIGTDSPAYKLDVAGDINVSSGSTFKINGVTICTSGGCTGNATTLQGGYTASSGGTTPEIKVDSTRGGLDLQDANATISGNLLTIRGSNASGLGSQLVAVSSAGNLTVGTAPVVYNIKVANTPAFKAGFEPLTANANTGGSSDQSVAVDYDNDGDKDVFIGASGNIIFIRNDGNGIFTNVGSLSSVGSAFQSYTNDFFAVNDYNGDGDYDIVTNDYQNSRMRYYSNNGNLTFAAPVDYAVSNPVDMRSFNVDGDGDMDIVAVQYFGTVSVLKNNGNGTFAAAVNYSGGTAASHMTFGDMDSDGDQDVIVARDTQNQLAIMMNNGTGAYAAPIVISVGSSFGVRMVTGNVDNDGDVDIVMTYQSTHEFRVLKNNGTATAFTTASFGTAGQVAGGTTAWPVLGDIDSDGFLDVVVNRRGNSSWGQMDLYLNNQTGAFNTGHSIRNEYNGSGNPPYIGNPVLTDYDNDTDLDIIFSEAGTSSLFIYKNIGSADLFNNDLVSTYAVGDINNDGLNDVITKYGTALRIHRKSGGSYVTTNLTVDGSTTKDIVIADFDNNGFKDILFDAGNNVQLVKNTNGTSFTVQSLNGMTAPVSNIEIGDFDGDGDIDAASVNSYSGSNSSSLILMINNGLGVFSNGGISTSSWVQNCYSSIIKGDFNNDGSLDVAIACSTQVHMFLNNGSGGFSAPTTTGATYTIESIKSTDVDNDGDLDIVGHYRGTNGIFVLRNSGTSALSNLQNFASVSDEVQESLGMGLRNLTLADVDNDGDTDAVLATSFYLGINYNNGNGNFASRKSYAPAKAQRYELKYRVPMVADLNNDADQDILFMAIEPGGSSAFKLVTVDNQTTVTVLPQSTGTLSVTTKSANDGGIYVQSSSGQVADLFRVQDASGAALLRIDINGNLRAKGSIGGGFGSPDYAENITASDPTIEAADVVVMDPEAKEQVIKTSTPYDATALGVISTSPGFVTNATAPDAEDGSERPLALSGRVPVKFSTENGPVAPGDYLTTSSTPGHAMKATQVGVVIGRAMAAFMETDGQACGDYTCGKVLMFIDNSYYNPTDGNNIQGADMTLTGMLQIGGSASIGGDLNVLGNTTLAGLTVTGNVAIEGNLTIAGSITTQNITINGHVITAGEAPIVTVESGAGADDPLQNLAPLAVVEGNDTSGTIKITTGSNPLADALAKIQFNEAFSGKPRIVLSAANRDAAKLGVYYDAESASTDSFMIMVDQTPEAGKTYIFTYYIVE